MKTKNTPETTTVGEQKIITQTNKTSKELVGLIGNNFSTRIKDHREEGEKMSRNGHMKSFVLEGKKFIAILGENKEDKSITNMPDDVKARYGAILKGYEMIVNHVCASYLPDQPPYDIRYPKALAYEHKDKEDILIIEWVDGLVSFEAINRGASKIPREHFSPINNFLDDWDGAIRELSIKSDIRKHSKSNSKYRQFIVKMPYGDVVVESDFGIRLNGNGEEVETLHNCGYILGRTENEKPIVYLTDGLVASSMKPIE